MVYMGRLSSGGGQDGLEFFIPFLATTPEDGAEVAAFRKKDLANAAGENRGVTPPSSCFVPGFSGFFGIGGCGLSPAPVPGRIPPAACPEYRRSLFSGEYFHR